MIDPTIELARVTSTIDVLQNSIADVQGRMDASILDSSQEDQTQLRLVLSKLKAALGSARSEEQFWQRELSEAKEARKAQGELTRA